ncbi:MAG: hypothetical protein HYW90_02290 [Candidatus Sungbacteria bacterium]|nr:hypothetical protein [Candidatus Sungbacteria bacterium]
MSTAAVYKEYIALLVLAIFACGLIIAPLSVKATVPTAEVVNVPILIGKAVLQLAELVFQSAQEYALVLKEYVLDPAAKLLVSFMIQTLTRAVIGWIQSGGNTNFISNLQAATARVADEAAGEFLNQLAGTNLCQPFSFDIKLIFQIPTLRDKLTCTATDIFRNLETSYENFLNNFTNGGWIAFQTAMLPQNNYIDVLINTYDEKLRRESRQVAILESQYQAGQGFVGVRIKKELCEDIIDDDGEPAASCTTQYINTTPGTLVSDQLKKTFSSGWDQAVDADEIGEAIDAIIVALVQQLISSAQAGLASGDEESGIYDPGFGTSAPLPRPLPNLFIPTGPVPTATTTILAGDTVRFRGTIQNNGGRTDELFNARFEIDVNADASVDAILSPDTPVDGLLDNGSIDITSGPWIATEGVHRIILCADQPISVVAESLETDNCNGGSSGTFAVGSRPDLFISQNPSMFSGVPVSGSKITFGGIVGNQGGNTATSTFENTFQIDFDNNGSIDVQLTPSPTIANLTPGTTQQVLSNQWTAVAGTHRVILCADTPFDTIRETNEANNCNPTGTGIFTITTF